MKYYLDKYPSQNDSDKKNITEVGNGRGTRKGQNSYVGPLDLRA